MPLPHRRLVHLMRPIRKLFPASGPSYELFDGSVFLVVLGFVGYVFTDPAPATDDALYAPFRVLAYAFPDPQVAWGLGMAVTGLFGAAAAYGSDRWVRHGFGAMIAICTFASGSFLVGMILFGASPRVILSVFIYGWIASGLHRARRLYPFREVPW